jgi:hypothetical protein
MSSISEHDSLPQTETVSLQQSILRPAQFVGFWTAVLSPFVLLGLIAAGIAAESPLTFSGVVAANVCGIVLGRGYNR